MTIYIFCAFTIISLQLWLELSTHNKTLLLCYSTTVPNCVIQYIILCSWLWTIRFVPNMYSRRKMWNKVDYKNCASRSLTHCIFLLTSAITMDRTSPNTSVLFCEYHATNAPCSFTHPSPTQHSLSNWQRC